MKKSESSSKKVILFANTDWYLYNFRRSFALALREAGHDVLLISPSGEYGEKLLALGLSWIPLPMERRSLNPLRELSLLWHLTRLLRIEKPDIIHNFTIKSVIYGSLAARLAGIRARINSVDGMGYVFTSNDVKARILRPVVRKLLHLALAGKYSRLILLNVDDTALFEQARLIDKNHIRLIKGAGVDCSRFFVNSSKTLTEGLRVLVAGRLLWDKGLAEYAEAARLLKSEGRQLQFLLAGTPDPGNPAAIPEDIIKDWGNSGYIEWLGHVSDMPDLLSSIDIMVLPSYREGLPTTLIEAAACALPLITTDVPGCREVVTDGVDGLLVPVRDAQALAKAIARLQDNPELAQQLGKAAREKALSQFDERIVIEQTLAVYRELLG